MTYCSLKQLLTSCNNPDLAFEDSTFPKHTDDFEEVSRYLEDHASFSFNLGQFDQIWEDYLAH